MALDYSKWDHIASDSEGDLNTSFATRSSGVDQDRDLFAEYVLAQRSTLETKLVDGEWPLAQELLESGFNLLLENRAVVTVHLPTSRPSDAVEISLSAAQASEAQTAILEMVCCSDRLIDKLCGAVGSGNVDAFHLLKDLCQPFSEDFEWVCAKLRKRKDVWSAVTKHALALEERALHTGTAVVRPWQFLHAGTWRVKAKHIQKLYLESGLHDACKQTVFQQALRWEELKGVGVHDEKRLNFILPVSVIASVYLCEGVACCKEAVAVDNELITSILSLIAGLAETGSDVSYNRTLQQVCSMLYEEGKASHVDKDTLLRNAMFRQFCFGPQSSGPSSFPSRNPNAECMARAHNTIYAPGAPGGSVDMSELRASKKNSFGVERSLPSRRRCFNCNAIAELGQKFDVCSGCGVANYCSRDCQKKHWKAHKKVCGK